MTGKRIYMAGPTSNFWKGSQTKAWADKARKSYQTISAKYSNLV